MAQNDNDKIETISGGELKKAFESFEAASKDSKAFLSSPPDIASILSLSF